MSRRIAILRRLLLSLLFLPLASLAQAEPVPGIAMHGAPALGTDAVHFPYVQPDLKKGGKVNYGVVGTFDAMNPFVLKGMRTTARGVWDPEFGNLLYESLMTRSADEPFTLYGLLAESVDWDADRTYVQFNLNPNARWNDGKPVTPDDVIFTFELLRDKGRPPFNSRLASVAKMEKVGEHGVKFTFNEKANRETPLIFASATPILPKHAVDAATFDQAGLGIPVGSGPYKVKELKPGEKVTWERDPNYWGMYIPDRIGFDNYDEITVTYFLQEATMFEAFKKGDIDIYPEGDANHWQRAYDFPAVAKGDVVKESFKPGLPAGMLGFVFNTRRSIFAEVKVREAISTAFDFEWLNKTLYNGAFTRTQSYWQNSALGAYGNASDERELALLGSAKDKLSPEILAGTYSQSATDGSGGDRKALSKAVKLFAEAGYKIQGGKMLDASGKPLAFEVMTQNEGQEKMALAFQRTLKLIGIDMGIRTVDDAQYQARSNSFDYDVIIKSYTSSLSPGAEQVNRWGSESRDAQGSFNYAGVADPDIDRMIEALLQAREPADFQAAVRAYDRLLVAGHYVVPLYHLGEQWVARWKHIGRPEAVPLYGYQRPTWFDARVQ
ncbi:MAG: extracellular solute-binding protein [Rhizobium sp.]|nr:extracellular solute-binding protein [Rhizobium sp.]